jgi:hypothetical protein
VTNARDGAQTLELVHIPQIDNRNTIRVDRRDVRETTGHHRMGRKL